MRLLPCGAALALLSAGCDREPEPSLVLHIAQGSLSAADASLSDTPGLVGVANLDDDDEDGVVDWDDPSVEGEDDWSLLEVELTRAPVALELAGDLAQVRVRSGDAVILGGEGGPTSARLDEVGATVALTVEFSGLNTRNTLTVREVAAEDQDLSDPLTLTLPLSGAPLILKHHLMPSVSTHAISSGTVNARFIEGYTEALGDTFTGYAGRDYDFDPWLQDEFEFAFLAAPDAFLDVVLDSIRNGQGNPGDGLDDLAEDHWVGQDIISYTPGTDGTRATSFDYFGNLEVSPPTTVGGVAYPFGRVYYGADGRSSPHQDLRDLLDAQAVQAPFSYTTAWLTVGHIDEFVSTVPAPGTERGWKLVITDVDAAWEVLEAMDPAQPLVRWNGSRVRYQGHGIDTVGEIVEDTALRALNEELQRDILDPALEVFMTELGLTEADVIRLPGLFEETGFGGVAALIPGMANLIVTNAEGQTPALFLADPFLRDSVEDQGADPMIARVREIMPEGVELVFLDDWFNYHMNLGEVHCGSKVQRTPALDWWTEAPHLLEAP